MSYNMNKLPLEIVHQILKYDGTMTYRNGKYMNKIVDPDKNYPLIVERMRFQRYRQFYSNFSFVTMQIQGTNTEKEMNYWATNEGLKINLYEWDYGKNSFIQQKTLFNNRDDPIS